MQSLSRFLGLCLLLALAEAVGPSSEQCRGDCPEDRARRPARPAGTKKVKGAKQHSLLQLKTSLSKVVLPPEDDELDLST